MNLDSRIQLKCSPESKFQNTAKMFSVRPPPKNLNDRLRPDVEFKTETPVYHETGIETFRSDGNALSAPTWSTLSGGRKGPN